MRESKETVDTRNQLMGHLISLGFQIHHGNGNRLWVSIDGDYANEVEVDINSKSVILDICKKTYEKGIVKGQNRFRTNLLSMLNNEVY